MSLTPQNPLEALLHSVEQGEVDEQHFFTALLDAQVFMPIRDKHHIAGFQESSLADPLVLEDEEGSQVMPLFSSPERARDFLKQFPGYEGGLLTEFRWVIERIGPGIGISMNPGLDSGFDLEAEMIEALRDSGESAQETAAP